MDKAYYRKYNDRSHCSSTYHKKDGTPIRHILKEETRKEIEDFLKGKNESCDNIWPSGIWEDNVH